MSEDGLFDEVIGHQLCAVDQGISGDVGQRTCNHLGNHSVDHGSTAERYRLQSINLQSCMQIPTSTQCQENVIAIVNDTSPQTRIYIFW